MFMGTTVMRRIALSIVICLMLAGTGCAQETPEQVPAAPVVARPNLRILWLPEPDQSVDMGAEEASAKDACTSVITTSSAASYNKYKDCVGNELANRFPDIVFGIELLPGIEAPPTVDVPSDST